MPWPSRKKKERRITEKQLIFCKEYLTNGQNGTQAAIKAGYSIARAGTAAIENLESRPVKAYLAKHIQRVERKMGLTVEYLLEKLQHIIENKLDDDPRTVITAIAEVAKLEGLYAAEKRVNVNTNINCDPHVEEVRRLMHQLIEKHKSEY